MDAILYADNMIFIPRLRMKITASSWASAQEILHGMGFSPTHWFDSEVYTDAEEVWLKGVDAI